MRTWLKEIRKGKEIPIATITNRCYITMSYYNMIENGTRNPSVGVSKSIAKLLNFDWTKFYDNNIESEESDTRT